MLVKDNLLKSCIDKGMDSDTAKVVVDHAEEIMIGMSPLNTNDLAKEAGTVGFTTMVMITRIFYKVVKEWIAKNDPEAAYKANFD